MTTNQTFAQASTFAWRGIHHLALATHDIDATVAFYRNVLGAQVSDVFPSQAGRGRHAVMLVNPADPNTLGLHFFERTNLSPPTRPATLEQAAMAGRLLHFALSLGNANDAQALRERLHAYTIEIVELPELQSFIFSDNNGLLIEVKICQT